MAMKRISIFSLLLIGLAWILSTPQVCAPFNGGERLAGFRNNYNQLDPRNANARVEADTAPAGNLLFYAPFIVIIILAAILIFSATRKKNTK
jgi:hypothetical protein